MTRIATWNVNSVRARLPRVIERDDAKMIIDEISWDYIGGAEIDYVEELIGAFFTIRNPNATSTCGCGTSFAVD